MEKDLLLNYVMPISIKKPTPAADTSYLRKMLVIVKPKGEVPATIAECKTKSEVEALTAAHADAALDAGMSSIYVLPTDTLDIAAILEASAFKYFTIAIDNAFDSLDTLSVGAFDGVIAWASTDKEKLKKAAAEKNNVAFFVKSENGSASMFKAFGSLLSANQWSNQQYISGLLDEGVNTRALAEELYEARVSFVLTSEQYGPRLALFASNKRAIVAPYVYEELSIRLQSTTLRYIAINQPPYTIAEAAKVEDTLQEVIDRDYVGTGLITSGTVNVEAVNDNFELSGEIVAAEPTALWRIRTVLQEGA